jgi:phytoene/squalene synthetase
MTKQSRKLTFSDIELYIYRVASLIFLLLTILKLLKFELKSW